MKNEPYNLAGPGDEETWGPCARHPLDPRTPESRIVTEFIHPPLPVRDIDWQAFYEGYEEDGPYGYGETEEEAIDNLESIYD